MVVIDLRLSDLGRSDLKQTLNSNALFFIPFASALIVGSALAVRRPAHPVGWLFLTLASAMMLGGVIDAYAAYGAVAKPGSLPGADVVAVLGASTFIPWIMLPALILLLTPSGQLTDRRRARRLGNCRRWDRRHPCRTLPPLRRHVCLARDHPQSARGIHWSRCAVRHPVERDHCDPPRGNRRGSLDRRPVSGGAIRRNGCNCAGSGMAAVPALLFVFGASTAAVLNVDVVAGALAGCFVAIIPLAVGLSIEQYHLYDVDRLVSRAVTWLVLTAALIATYIVVVVFVGQSIGSLGDSQIPAIVATLAAATAFSPLRRWVQDKLDRRFNRRRFETLARLRAYAREPAPSVMVEQALRTATGDPTLAIAYWIADRESWANERACHSPRSRRASPSSDAARRSAR